MNVNINKVIVAGRVCQTPQLKSANSGTNFCRFSLAVNRHARTPDGQPREETDYVDITAFGKTADNCAHFLQKGNAIFVEAKLRQETWKDKNTNQNRHRLTLVADRVHFLEATPPRRIPGAFDEPQINRDDFSPMASAPRIPPRHLARNYPAPRPAHQEIYDEPEF